MGLIVSAPAVVLPVEETIGCPEFFIDGSIMKVTGGVGHIICFVERGEPPNVVRYEVLRVHLTIEAMNQSMIRCAQAMIGGDVVRH